METSKPSITNCPFTFLIRVRMDDIYFWLPPQGGQLAKDTFACNMFDIKKFR